MDKEKNTKAVSEGNIYCLNGRVAPGFRSLWESVLPFLVVC